MEIHPPGLSLAYCDNPSHLDWVLSPTTNRRPWSGFSLLWKSVLLARVSSPVTTPSPLAPLLAYCSRSHGVPGMVLVCPPPVCTHPVCA